jgi:beta-1,2-mannobiose phosphorylase / 1,2-beta-oligomannan phosphorylase
MITHCAALKTSILATLGIAFSLTAINGAETTEKMRWTDTSRGKSIAKDPSVIHFKDHYLMYYSLPPFGDKRPGDGWAIGIAESRNLTDWKKVGELLPSQSCEHNGLAAPGAWIRDGKVHIFYCT